MEKKLRIILIIFSALLIVSIAQNWQLNEVVSSGKHLAAARPQIIISADCPWANLPPALKEYISLNATLATKLNKDDMLQLSEYYRDMASKYKEAIALKDVKDYPIKPKEAVK